MHLKIDSGMNRQGLFPSEVERFLDSIRGIPEIELVGVMTHFACVTEDPATIDFQLDRFLPAVEQVRREWPGRARPRRQQRRHRAYSDALTWTWSVRRRGVRAFAVAAGPPRPKA